MTRRWKQNKAITKLIKIKNHYISGVTVKRMKEKPWTEENTLKSLI